MSERGEVDLNDAHRSYYHEKYINQLLKGVSLQCTAYMRQPSKPNQTDTFARCNFFRNNCFLVTARLLDGIDIRGYTAWSLMDNLEWATGFSERFGLFYVNHSDPNLSRVAKSSVAYYSSIISCNGFPDPASGPHECLKPGPEATVPPPLDYSVSFLGMELSPGDAETGLYATFSLLIFAMLGAVSVSFWLVRSRKQLDDPSLSL
ncbi:unnamed protein product [Arctogadus glacialis]